MKKYIILFTIVGFTFNGFAQDKAILKGDTAYYKGEKYFEGKIINIGYGSASDKTFAFIRFGPVNAPTIFSKTQGIVKGFKNVVASKPYLKVKIDKSNVVVDLEGAIDNKELLPDTP
jgi:hypothetical protein